MIFGINGMYLTANAAGIGNVIINVINKISSNHKIILFANKQINENTLKRFTNAENIECVIKYRQSSTLWFFLDYPKLIKKYHIDYLWCPAVWMPFNIKGDIKTIVSVNDFVSRDFKTTMRFFNRVVSSIIEKKSIKKADYLWCISDYTKQCLEDYYPKRKCKEIFVGCAPDPFIKKIDDSDLLIKVQKELKLPKQYILFVGSLEPRKNLKFLLKVYKEYAKTNNELNLVIVGAKGWGKTEITEIINNDCFPKDRVLFTGFVSEEQLRAIYNLATVYISTSLNEGFGLPQVEAMNCEIPVISPHNSAMIEVVNGAGVTIDSWEINKWKKAIDFTLENREKIINQQNERRKQYSWEVIISRFYDYIGK